MMNCLRKIKTKRMQTGAIRYRQRLRMRMLRFSLKSTEPTPQTPTEDTVLLRLLRFLVIPARILILIIAPLLRAWRRSDWLNCETS